MIRTVICPLPHRQRNDIMPLRIEVSLSGEVLVWISFAFLCTRTIPVLVFAESRLSEPAASSSKVAGTTMFSIVHAHPLCRSFIWIACLTHTDKIRPLCPDAVPPGTAPGQDEGPTTGLRCSRLRISLRDHAIETRPGSSHVASLNETRQQRVHSASDASVNRCQSDAP